MDKDFDDLDFVEKLQKMFGYTEEHIQEFLSKIHGDELLALNDAVANDDRERAEDIINKNGLDEEGELSINPLFRNGGEDDIEVDSTGDETYEVGERVKVKINVDGKSKMANAVVKNPNAPKDTVEVMIGNKSRMVDKHNVEKLEEAIMGMTAMPSLARIQQLAGISVDPVSSSEVEMEVIPQEPIGYDFSENQIDDEIDGEIDPRSRVFAALEQIRNDISQITVADLKIVKQKLADLNMFINEDFKVDLGRKKKL